MQEPTDRHPGRSVSRRGVLAAGLGLVAAGCGSTTERALGRRGSSAPVPDPAATSTTAPTVPATTTTTAPPLSRVPTTPVTARTKPVFYVHDLLPTAPANAVALTIDDGPDPRYTPAVLAVLARYQVHASFSVIGRYAAKYPDMLRQIVAEGHLLTNHSMNHPEPFARLPADRMQAEVVGCLEAIYDATGAAPTTFRSPGGDWSPPMFDLIASLGMDPIDWDVDPRDWSRPGVGSITSRMLAARPGDVLLCHDGGGDRSETVKALGTVIPALKARGLTFVTL